MLGGDNLTVVQYHLSISNVSNCAPFQQRHRIVTPVTFVTRVSMSQLTLHCVRRPASGVCGNRTDLDLRTAT